MQNRLNAYRVMWLFVFFDLPTNTKKERKSAQIFRKRLLKNGFRMMQYSVYNRHCASTESAEVQTKRIKSFIPNEGHVSILRITDKQYGMMDNFFGSFTKPPPPSPNQLEMF